MLILPIAHKYCMETIEAAIIKRLQKLAKDTETYVDLMVASQLLDSKPMYAAALSGLRSYSVKPNLKQASRIGLPTYFAVMENLPVRCNNCLRDSILRCSP